MYSKEEAFAKVSELVERFALQVDSYKKNDYNETQTRQDFINPFFKALGWDIDNSQGNAEAYREVIHEDKIKIGSATKAPDYSFRLPGGKRLFFVEAKKPSILVKEDIIPSYQVRRYGWSAKLPISLVTDFEEFAIYDCTKKPNPDDKASTARIKYITYKNYLEEFDFIWNTFSKQSVLKGSFDKFILSDTHKKGTATVDKEFLKSLDEWRKLLAQNIALRNQNLTEDELNFVVQQTIDRIIFLRIAEDRGVEGYGELKEFLKPTKEEGSYFKALFKLFKEADSKYNSGLFDFKKDTLSANISIDNKIIKTVISELYYPVSPYEFSVLGVEILGSAYEQFLGKQIKLDKNHRAVIEEKPEVRKAGGVYYTPQYIVDYIVENTVGKLTEGKAPEQVAQLKIVDPACGSGSFLIGAYKYLLTWHLNYYKPEFIKHSETAADTNTNTKTREAAIKQRNKLPLTPEGNLTTALKKQILLNNIYGVDIDSQAVEVTKLSLLLKCMEGETSSSINAVMHFGERVLPTLDNNIKSGNSLIDIDFYDTQFDFGEDKKVKPFNWKQAFPNVFKQGGFDVVIGNPPWGVDFNKESLNYLRNKNTEIIVRMIDSFMYFVYRSYELIKSNGSFGMILPDVLFYQTDNSKLREYILNNSSIEALLNLGNVFEKVNRPSCIIITSKKERKNFNIITVDLTKTKRENKPEELYNKENFKQISQSQLKEIPGNLFVTTNANHFQIIKKIKNKQVKSLLEFVDEDGIQRGVSPDLKEAFLVTSEQAIQFNLEKKYLRNVLTGGRQVKRFYINYPDLQLIYTRRDDDFNSIPNIRNYINQFKAKITCKEVSEHKHSLYSLHRAREEKIFTKSEKLIGVITEDEIIVSIDNNKTFATDGLYVFGAKEINIKYLMGILNSRLFVFLYRLTTMESGRTLAQVKPTTLNDMPIRVIDQKNKKEKALHDEVVKHVDSMLELNKQKQITALPEKLEQLNQRIAYTDDKINKLVYELYGLSGEEIGIVENIKFK